MGLTQPPEEASSKEIPAAASISINAKADIKLRVGPVEEWPDHSLWHFSHLLFYNVESHYSWKPIAQNWLDQKNLYAPEVQSIPVIYVETNTAIPERRNLFQ